MISPYGNTYDKEAIVSWLNTKNQCPLTKKPLSLRDLRLNKNALFLIKYLALKEKYNKDHPLDTIKNNEILF